MTTTISFAANEIRAADAVVVLGAGVSFAAGMPLAGQLAPLVWHALDSNPEVLNALCVELKIPVSDAKTVVSDDAARVNSAFRHIKANVASYRTFKKSIGDLDASRGVAPSSPHTALARLVHTRKVVEVVSFNWDTLLESAFEQRFGFEINAQGPILTKPHGDCRSPEGEWILPHEDGVVPDSLLHRLTRLAAIRPRVLLIIGYSERDAEVVKKLIQPLANQWRVIRVSPSATGEGAIALPSGVALEELAANLAPEPSMPGWSIVTFANQRGIEAAIAGERLGPRDVQACPRLPHSKAALEKLSMLHSVEIAGDSGSGKSITVWQLAYEFHQKGWQVLRLDAAQKPMFPAALEVVRSQTWRTVAVVDDSQIFPRDAMDRLRDLANERKKVVFGTTDPSGEQQDAVRAAARTAVEAIAGHCRDHREALLPVVRRFDSHVGDGFLDERIESRIDRAAKEQTPWQFAYVLRGGNRKVRELIGAARDFAQADLLLVLIAARQLATLDAGTPVADLIGTCAKIGRSEAWVQSALDCLSRQRAILTTDVVRCLHLMSAGAIIEASLDMRKADEYAQIVALVQGTLRDSSLPLRGISWLLHHIWHPHNDIVVADDIKAELISRCVSAKSHLEIRDACFVMERLLGRRNQKLLEQVIAHQELLRSWIAGADAIDAYAIGGMLNSIRNGSAKHVAELLGGIDPEVIARKVGLSSLENGYVWGTFLQRLCFDKNDVWAAAVAAHLPRDTIRGAVRNMVSRQLGDFTEYVQAIACFDFDFALELFEIATPSLAREIAQDSIRTYRELFDTSHWILGEGLFLDAKPSKRQRRITKAIFDGLKPAEVVEGIVSCRFGEWENYARLLAWVRRAHPPKHRAIVQAMDWSALDAAVTDKLEIPGRELTLLLAHLTLDPKSHDPVSSWLLKHAGKMKEIGSRIVVLCPRAAQIVLSRGGKINLDRDHANWLLDAYVITQTAALDEDTAKEMVRSNIAHFSKGIAELSFPEGMAKLLALLAQEPDLFDRILASVDLVMAKERWPNVLTDNRLEWRKPGREVLNFLAEREKGELGQLAAHLVRHVRFRRRHPVADE